MMHRPSTLNNRVVSSTLLITASATDTVGDPQGTRTITSIVALLVAMGLALVMVAVWLHRSTRPDPELLAPLEMMGERKWRRADPVWQRRRLDELRPDGAEPLEPSSAPPEIDEAFDRGPTAPGFDDLHGDVLDDDRESVAPAVSGTSDRVAAPTPQDLPRPELDDFPDGDVDPEVMAAAMAEIDAELGRGSDLASD